MAFGDLIYNQKIPAQVPFGIGQGITSMPGQFVLTGLGKYDFNLGYFDVTDNLNFTKSFSAPEAFTSIHYNEADDSFWALAPYVDTGFPNLDDIYVFHFNSDGTPISSFNVSGIFLPSADTRRSTTLSLSPDGNEVLVALRNDTKIYRFSKTGNYLGVFDFSPDGNNLSGITTDGENLWICTAYFGSPNFTIYKTDSNFNILDSFTDKTPDFYNSIDDIEFDKYNFAPGCAIVMKTSAYNEENSNMFIYGYEVSYPGKHPCRKPPVITADNQCLAVGDPFDPLANVSATDCDGSDIPVTEYDIVFNDVDTSAVGMYTVTYSVTSPTNGLTTIKTIYVDVIAAGPRHQAITDIIQSIALEQTALGHILSAECEKVQKAKELCLTNAEMIKINDSVEDMVKSIASLEMVLQTKLRLFSDCLCVPECKFSSQ